MLFAITLTWPKTVFTKRNIDFLKNSRLNSHQNALNQCKTLMCNENNNFVKELLLVFQKKHVICNHTYLA